MHMVIKVICIIPYSHTCSITFINRWNIHFIFILNMNAKLRHDCVVSFACMMQAFYLSKHPLNVIEKII